MKQAIYSMGAIALTSISSSFIAVSAVPALEEGLYWGGGSRYIQIAKKSSLTGDADGDRYCYQGYSSNGMLISSLKLKIPRYQTGIDYEVYVLESPQKSSLNNLAILQYGFSPNKIIFGKPVGRSVREGLVYEQDGVAATAVTPELQECLNSTQPYFKQILSGRDRR